MDVEIFYKNIAKSIKFYRNKLHISQEQLAEKSGLSTDYIGKIETCINKPGLVGLFKIINALEISFSEFFSAFK